MMTLNISQLMIETLEDYNNGRYLEAISKGEVLIYKYPDDPFGLKILGSCYAAIGEYDKSFKIKELCYQKFSGDCEVVNNYGNAIRERGELFRAILIYDESIRLNPNYYQAIANLSSLYADLKIYDKCIEYALKSIEINPRYTLALSILIKTYYIVGDLIKSNEIINHCNVNQLIDADILRAVAYVEYCQANFIKAIDAYKKIFLLGNAKADDYCNFAASCRADGRAYDALVSIDKALKMEFKEEYFVTKAAILLDLSNLDEAVKVCEEGLALFPNCIPLYSNMIFCANNINFIDDRMVDNFKLKIGSIYKSIEIENYYSPSKTTIKLGFVSGDFRNHALVTFFYPILRELSKYSYIEVYCYGNYPSEDQTTQKIKQYSSKYVNITFMKDDDVVGMIRNDRVDVLFDLSGHTAFNRLSIFGKRSAPIQASWLGWVGSTYIPNMDYYLSDKEMYDIADVKNFTEKVIYLDSVAPIPMPNPLPLIREKNNSSIFTFASYNRISKISRETFEAWAEILNICTNSELFIYNINDDKEIDRIKKDTALSMFIDRIKFFKRMNSLEYFASFNDVDLLLDTFPYTGGTTSVNALVMGVPIISISGSSMLSKQGKMILSKFGMKDFVVFNYKDYVKKSVEFYKNYKLDNVVKYKTALKESVISSSFFNAELVVSSLLKDFLVKKVKFNPQ